MFSSSKTSAAPILRRVIDSNQVALQAKAIQYSVDAEDRRRAALIANEVLTAMPANKSATLPPTTLAALQARAANVAAGGLPNASVTASTPASSNLTTITVTWRSPAKKTSEADSTYFTQMAMP